MTVDRDLAIIAIGVTMMLGLMQRLKATFWERLRVVGFCFGLFLVTWGAIDTTPRPQRQARWPVAVLVSVGTGIWMLRRTVDQDEATSRAGDGFAIESLEDGALVDWKVDVTGRVTPANAPVQVFVLSSDRRWYPQPTDVAGNAWRSRCTFGVEAGRSGVEYHLAAVAGGERVTGPVAQLPGGWRTSKVITVRRR